MTNLYVSNATQAALGIPLGAKKKTPRQIIGAEDDPEEAALKAARNQALTRGMTAAVGGDLAASRAAALSKAGGLSFDRAGLEKELVGETEREAQEQRARLARQFGIDPGGAQSGTSQRAFENLESGVLGAKASIRTQLRQMEGEQQRANVGALAGVYSQMSERDLSVEAQRLQAVQAAGQALSQDEQNLLAAYQTVGQQGVAEQQVAIAGRAQTETESMGAAQRTQMVAQTGIAQRAQTETEKMGTAQRDQMAAVTELQRQAQNLDDEIRRAELSGDIRGKATLQAQRQELEAEIQRAQVEVQRGQLTGLFAGKQTLAAQAQTFAEGIEQARLTGTFNNLPTLEAAAQQVTLALQEAAATGTYQSKQTLQATLQDAQLELEEAGLTGKFAGQATLQKLLQDAQVALEAGQLTGTYGGGMVSLTTLGVDIKGLSREDAFFLVEDRLTRLGYLEGKTDDEKHDMVMTLLGGNQISIPGAQTLAAERQTADIEAQRAQTTLARARLTQEGQQFLTQVTGKVNAGMPVKAEDFGIDVTGAFDKTGNFTEAGIAAWLNLSDSLGVAGITLTPQQTKDIMHGRPVTAAVGTTLEARTQGAATSLQSRQLAQQKDLEQQRINNQKKIEEAQISGKLDDLPTLQAKQQEIDKTLRQVELRTQAQQFLTQATGKVNAGLAVSAQDFGIDTGGVFDEKGQLTSAGFDRYFELVDALTVAGLEATPTQLNSMLRGVPTNLAGPGTTLAARAQGADVALRGRQVAQQQDLEQKRINLQQEAQDNQKKIEEAQLSGRLNDLPTLQARQQEIDQSLRQIELRTQAQQFLTEATGKVNAGLAVSAQDFGIDTVGIWDEKDQLTTAGYDKYFQLADALNVAGMEPTDEQLKAMLHGLPVNLAGPGTTLAARVQGSEVASRQQQLDLQQKQLDLQQEQQDNQKKLAEAEISGTLNDRDTLAARQQQIDQQLKQIDQQMQQQRFLTEQTGRVGGTGTISAADLGIDVTGIYNPDRSLNVDKYLAAVGQVDAALQAAGITLDPQKMESFLRGQSVQATGATTIEARRLGVEASELVAQRGLEYNRQQIQVGEMLGKYGEKDTLAATQQKAVAEIQQGTLSLDTQRELARQREEVMRQTGNYTAVMSIDTLIPGVLNENGTVDPQRFLAGADSFVANFRAMSGREATPEELAAIVRGQVITVTTGQTLEKQIADNQNALQRAEHSGLLWDPETGQNLDTLRKQDQQFQQSLADRQQSWAQIMDLAREAGYVSVGQNGKLTAKDLGVDAQFLRSMPAADRVTTVEAQRLKESYRAMTGGELSSQQLNLLLDGNEVQLAQPIRVETVEARAQREQSSLSWSELSGKIGTAKTEVAREFDATLLDRGNLTTAQVAQINAGIRQADTQIEQQLIQFAAEKQIAWAELLGEGYGNGTVNAGTLSVTLPAGPPGTWSEEQRQHTAQTLANSYTAMTGQPPTPAEIATIINRGSVNVSNAPTLAARELAATVSTQGLDRLNDLHKFSTQFGLDERKFTEAQEEADRQYAQAATQISQAYGLDQQKFLLAKMEVSAKATGRIGISGNLSAQDLGIVLPSTPPQYLSNAERTKLNDDIRVTFTALQGRAPTALEIGAISGGSSVSVQAQSTQEAREWAASQAEVARRYGLDERQFTEASSQFDRQYQTNERNSWLQLNGFANVDAATGELKYTGVANVWTTEYRKYSDAKTEFEKTERKRDDLWQKAIYNSMAPENVTLQEMIQRGLLPSNAQDLMWQSTSELNQVNAYFEERTGYRLTQDQLVALRGSYSSRGGSLAGLIIPKMSEQDINALVAMISGHEVAVSQSNQGNGWMQLAGTAIATAGTIYASRQGGTP